MKVMISTRAVYPCHGFGGMERYYYNLAKHLVKEGIKVEIITTSNKILDLKLRLSEYNGIKFWFLPLTYFKKLPMPIWYRIFNICVKKFLENYSFDILHGTAGTHPYSSLKNRKPVIHQPFGLELFKTKGIVKVYCYAVYYHMNVYMHKNADAIASEGEIQTKEIMQLFEVPREKIFYLPDGVDLDEIEEYLENTEITREDYNLQDADIVLMNVNRLEPNKGVQYLIEALKILNEELNVKLILVGTGSEEGKIKNQIRRLGLTDKVRHFKNIPDKLMFQLYTLADISVTPTLYEGLPLVVLEAMACGKPIVASNVSEVPHAVKEGIYGFLVPPRAPKAIAD